MTVFVFRSIRLELQPNADNSSNWLLNVATQTACLLALIILSSKYPHEWALIHLSGILQV